VGHHWSEPYVVGGYFLSGPSPNLKVLRPENALHAKTDYLSELYLIFKFSKHNAFNMSQVPERGAMYVRLQPDQISPTKVAGSDDVERAVRNASHDVLSYARLGSSKVFTPRSNDAG